MIPGDRHHNALEMAAEREAWLRDLSDGDRMSFYRNEGMSDAEIIAAECERYGIVAIGEPLGAWALLRHVYNNRDAAYGAQKIALAMYKAKVEIFEQALNSIVASDNSVESTVLAADALRDAYDAVRNVRDA